MLGDFDIQSAARVISSAGDIVETETVSSTTRAYDGKGFSVVVNGNITVGAFVKGTHDLLVQGWVVGSEDTPCRVESEGDVVIEGEVRNARIKGRSIRIGGETMRCQLNTQRGVEIAGGMSGTKIVTGEFDADRMRIAKLREKILRTQRIREFKDRQLRIDQKRVPRLIGRTRFTLDFSIGQIVKHWIVQETQKQIEIDLQPFYDAMGDRSEKEIDLALREFFTTAVMGTLVRANQQLIEINVNRRKVFMGTMRKLHDLLFLVREIDKLADEVARTETEMDKQIDILRGQTSAVYVRGPILPNIDLEFVLPDVAWSDEGEAVLGMQTTRLVLQQGAAPYEWELQLVDINGRSSVRSLNPDDLQGDTFRVNEGWIDWA